MKRIRTLCAAAALLLAACGGDSPPRDAGGARSDSVQPALDTSAALVNADTAAATPGAPVPPRRARTEEPAPTREDSIAAAAEDVSPEWKQRERSMEKYADCMEKAQSAEGPVRIRLEAACGNLPDAPR